MLAAMGADMGQAGPPGLAIAIGGGLSLQVALLGALSRERGPSGAVIVSLLGPVTGVALVAAVRAWHGGTEPDGPLEQAWGLGLLALAFGGLLALAARGRAPGFAATGLLALPFLFGSSTLGPRLGIGLYLWAVIAGQVGSGVLLDHVGAFGAEARRADPVRLAGVAALLLGVALVRGRG